MTDRKAKMLERVRALLAQADSSNFEGEKDAFRAKADELMELYAIEEWQVERSDGSPAKPERRYMDFSWFGKGIAYEALWSMFYSTAAAARCKVVTHDWSRQKGISVLGLPADLDYMDLLFTSLMMQMVRHIDPEYDQDRTLDENIYALRMAGMGWPAMAERFWTNKIIDVPKGHTEDKYGQPIHFGGEQAPWKYLRPDTQQSMRSRLASRYRSHAKSHGLAQNYDDPKVYQRSYCEGFSDAVANRLWAIRRERQAARTATSGSDNPFAVALRDIDQAIRSYYEELYAEYLARLAAQAAEDAKKKKRRPRTSVDRRVFSQRAAEAGGEAGMRADISTNGAKLGSRKVIN